jgi:hypothetical protein
LRFLLFVEGHTERALPAFLKRWLDPRLPQPVRITPVRFEGWRHYREEIAKKVALNLSGKNGADVVGAIGLLDLYGPDIYPAGKVHAEERREWAKSFFEGHVGHPRFRQHFAVHETEAWLLADPALLPVEVRRALPGKCSQPERVNFDEPPGKLLERLYREKLSRKYKKVIDGRDLLSRLQPETAYEKCPSLKLLLDDMLALAAQGFPTSP